MDAAQAALDRWLADPSALSAEEFDILARLLMVELAARQMVNEAAVLSSEVTENLLALVQGWQATAQAIEHACSALLPVTSGVPLHAASVICDAAYALTWQMWAEQPLQYMAAQAPQRYAASLGETFQRMVDTAQRYVSGEASGGSPTEDKVADSMWVAGTTVLLNQYIQHTQPDLSAALQAMTEGTPAGTLAEAFRYAISQDAEDDVTSLLEVAQARTRETEEASNALQDEGSLAARIQTIEALFSVMPTPEASLIPALSEQLYGISLAPRAMSSGLAGTHIVKLRDDTDAIFQGLLHPGEAGKRKPSAPTTQLASELQYAGHLSGWQDVYLAYSEKIKEIAQLAQEGQKSAALAAADTLRQLGKRYDSHMRTVTAPVWAAAAEAQEREGFAEAYGALLDAALLTTQERLVWYGHMLEYALNDPTDAEPLVAQAEAVGESMRAFAAAVQAASESVSDVEVPAFILVSEHHVQRLNTPTTRTVVVSAVARNLGSVDASHVTLRLHTDALAAVLPEIAIQDASVAVGDSLVARWEVAIADTVATPVSYRIDVELANGRAIGGYGAIISHRRISPLHTGTDDLGPRQIVLVENYPNPFRGQTTLGYSLPEPTPVQLVVFDMLGREVARLVQGVQQAGMHEVVFDAQKLPSGVYMYRLETPAQVLTRTMMQLR